MFVNRFIGLGFELPVILFSGTILMSIALDKPVSCSSCTFRTLHNTCASWRHTGVIIFAACILYCRRMLRGSEIAARDLQGDTVGDWRPLVRCWWWQWRSFWRGNFATTVVPLGHKRRVRLGHERCCRSIDGSLCPSPRQRLAGYRFGFGLRVVAIAGRHAPKPCLNCSTLTSWWHCLLLSTSMWKQANDQRRLSDCPQKTSGRPFHQKGVD